MKFWEWLAKNWGPTGWLLTAVLIPLGGFVWRKRIKTLIEVRRQRLDRLAAVERQTAEILALLKPNGGSSVADTLARIERETYLQQSVLMALQDVSGLAFWRSDATGYCTHASSALGEFAGLDQSQILGMGWISAIHPEDRVPVNAEWEMAVRQKRRFSMSYRFQHSDKARTVIPVNAEAMPILAANRDLAGFVGVLRRTDKPRNSQDA